MPQVDSTAPERRGQTAVGACCEPAAWLERLHARVINRIPDAGARGALRRCWLRMSDCAGWPSWTLVSADGVRLSEGTRKGYREALLATVGEAVSAITVVNSPVEPDPDDGLMELWRSACERLELPSTRMLLQAQGRLLSVDRTTALVAVGSEWLPMVQSRRAMVETALAEVLGQPVAVSFQEVQA